MSQPRYFVIRRPRHSALGENETRVWLELPCAESRQQREAQLVDFSRMGAKFELTAPLMPDEPFLVRIQQSANGVDVTLPAVVRWQSARGGGRWSMGCRFEHEVPYEVVGQLFLSGLLATETSP